MEQGFKKLDELIRVLFPELERGTRRANGALDFFLTSRLVIGVGGLAALPPMVVTLGLDRTAWLIVILGLAAQLGACVLAANETIKFEYAYALSLGGLASALTAFSGHMGLVALIPMVIEAGLMLDRRFAYATGAVLSVIVTLTLVAGDGITSIAPLGTPAFLSAFLLALTATGIGISAMIDKIQLRERAYHDLHSASAALVGTLDRGVAIADQHGHIYDPSPMLIDITGLSAHEMMGDALLSRVHLLSRPAFLKAISDALHQDKTIETRVKLQCRVTDDAPLFRDFDMRVNAIAVTEAQDDRHAVISFAAAADDEAIDLKPLRDELYEAQLRHELKTPLNAILGFAELLGNPAIVPEDDPRRNDYIKIIATSARHLVDLLDHMKVNAEAGMREDDEIEAVEVAALIKDALAMLKLSADEQGVVIEQQIEENLPRLIGQRHGLCQILLNLVSNAVKFSPEGRIVIAAEQHIAGVQLSVSDDGIGMDDQDLQRVGEPFFRGSASESGFEDGEGLGLAVVRGLVERHGGEFSIESAPGNGTTVRVLFQRVHQDRYQHLRVLADIDEGQSPLPVDLPMAEEWRRKIA